MSNHETLNPTVMTLGQRFWQLNWFLILLICALASVEGQRQLLPWAERQMVQFSVSMFVMLAIALTDIRLLLKYAYCSTPAP